MPFKLSVQKFKYHVKRDDYIAHGRINNFYDDNSHSREQSYSKHIIRSTIGKKIDVLRTAGYSLLLGPYDDEFIEF